MNVELEKIRAKLAAERHSRSRGMRAIADRSRTLGERPLQLSYGWLTKLCAGKIHNPGFERVERLREVIASLERQEGPRQ